MNHSTSVKELHYGRSASTLLNVREGVQKRYLSFCLRFFAYFHILDLDLKAKTLPFISALNYKGLLNEAVKGGL
jgi:hypothetical protein